MGSGDEKALNKFCGSWRYTASSTPLFLINNANGSKAALLPAQINPPNHLEFPQFGVSGKPSYITEFIEQGENFFS